MKNRSLKILESIIDGVDNDSKIAEYDKYFASLVNPKVFTGRQGVELRYDRGFEQNCITLSKYTNAAVKDVSVREYFSLLQHFNKENNKSGRK